MYLKDFMKLTLIQFVAEIYEDGFNVFSIKLKQDFGRNSARIWQRFKSSTPI